MAEALSLIGSLSAIMQLTGYLVKSTRELVACVETIRSAPKEIDYFILETSIFTDQLRYFHDLAKDSTEKLDENFKAKRAKLVHKIVRQCSLVRRGFSRLVKRFVEVNGTGTEPFNTLRARILWLWKKPDVPELRLSLQSATANVMLLCNLFSYEELIRKNAKDERLEMLQEQLQNWVSTVKKLRHELADYQRRKQSAGNESESAPEISYSRITVDTRDLEKYVVKTIQSHAREEALSKAREKSPPPPPPGPTVRKAPKTSSPKFDIVVGDRRPTELWTAQKTVPLPKSKTGVAQGEGSTPSQGADITEVALSSPASKRRRRERPFSSEVRAPRRGPHPEVRPEVHGPDATKTANAGSSSRISDRGEEERQKVSETRPNPDDLKPHEVVRDEGIRVRPVEEWKESDGSPRSSGSRSGIAKDGHTSPIEEHPRTVSSSSKEARARRRPRRPKSQPPAN
ncbi:C-24(28) sterol reductase [Hypoxylon texense]